MKEKVRCAMGQYTWGDTVVIGTSGGVVTFCGGGVQSCNTDVGVITLGGFGEVILC